jgi:hypothetical protein
MKIICISLILCLLLLSCKATYQVGRKNEMKTTYLRVFKMTYFRNILKEGFNNSEAFKSIFENQFSGYGEPLLYLEDLKLIKTLAKEANLKLTKDSIERIGRVGEGAEGKHVVAYALEEYNSKWLDSLAKARYKFFKKIYRHYDSN